MNLLLGTNNRGKIVEMREVLSDLPFAIITPNDVGITQSPHETGDTFHANAEQKARFYFERSFLRQALASAALRTGKQDNIMVVADDSGIVVEALRGELGIHTRRWGAGPDASDEEWIRFFLDRMKHETNKRARFVCVLHLIDESGGDHQFEGACDGIITNDLEAEYLPGLPISACFKPDGCDAVFSALSINEKNRVSHRGKAVWQLKDFLQRKP